MDETLSINLESAAKAFEAWENEYRLNPEGFLTSEESAAMEVADVSEGRAIYFMAILRKAA